MQILAEKIIQKLKANKQTVALMESCTGGLVSSELTNISGSSEVFHLGIVAYQNEEKIKHGVKKETIDKYTVYSKQVASEMARAAAMQANADWGIGTTGLIGNLDPENPLAKSKEAYYSIYEKKKDHCETYHLILENDRVQNKYEIIHSLFEEWLRILEE